MLIDVNVKKSWISLICKYYLKQITKTREKLLQPLKAAFSEKWPKNFKTLGSTYYAK